MQVEKNVFPLVSLVIIYIKVTGRNILVKTKLIILPFLFVFLTIQVYSRDRIIDNARLLSVSQKNNLIRLIDSTSTSFNFDLVIVSEIDIGNTSPKVYADNFFDNNGYGLGSNRDGCLFLLVTGSRDYWLSTSGRGNEIFDSYVGDKLLEDILNFLSEENFYEAFQVFIRNWVNSLNMEKYGTIWIDSVALYREYRTNVMRADNQYKGKNLIVTGRILNIKQEPSGEYYLELTGDGIYRNIRVYFRRSEVYKLADLLIGQRITIIGTCDGTNGLLDVYIRNSIIPN
jgi:hypothetical protein